MSVSGEERHLWYQHSGAFLIYGDDEQPWGFRRWTEEAEADLIERGYAVVSGSDAG